MDILGIGFPELVFIFIIALMVFGPRRLPEIAGKAGRIVRDLRNMSQGFLAEWQREITVAARLEELEQVRQELEATKQSLRQTQAEIASGTAQVGQSLKAAATSAKQAVRATSPASPAAKTAETSQVVKVTDPPADDSTPPAASPPEAVEAVSEPPDAEKNGNSPVPAPQPLPATKEPSEVVE